MNLISIPVLRDNYVWILVNKKKHCLIVDPGEAVPIINIIKKNHWRPIAILLTHYHNDHINGIFKIKSHFPNIEIFGPKEIQRNNITCIVNDGKNIIIGEWNISVISTPGHTIDHVSFYIQHYLFCGDTMFSGGCGKILDGTSKQMYESLQRINSLPEETLICCAHEYTLNNMKFALSILPNNSEINNYYNKVNKLRITKQQTLPSTLKNERNVNLFLKTKDIDLIKEINKEIFLQSSEQRFTWLRLKKDNFNYK